jgi:hypothetical protein
MLAHPLGKLGGHLRPPKIGLFEKKKKKKKKKQKKIIFFFFIF